MTTASDDLIGMLRAEGDFAHVFGYHPFNIELADAHGIWLQDTAGRRYIDASGGPMAVNIGHGDPRMKAAIAAQLDHFAYCHPMLANRPRAELAAAIARHTPPGLSAVYLVSGGSEAVETALKLARQYWVAEGRPGKHKVVSNFESYHGHCQSKCTGWRSRGVYVSNGVCPALEIKPARFAISTLLRKSSV